MSERPLVVVLAGPTGVGKTALALALAESLATEIVGADSRQVYRLMDIGTAKPTPAEQARVRHWLIDVVFPDQPFSAGRYAELARPALDRLIAAGRVPLLVGGTGLYLRAVLEGICPAPPADEEVRARLRRQAAAEPGSLHRRLAEIDPPAAARIPPADLTRIVRALEIAELAGRPASRLQAEHAFADRPYRVRAFFLHRPRPALAGRIAGRLAAMLAAGFVAEVERLLAAGYSRSLRSMSGHGYRRLAAHLAGEVPIETAAELTRIEIRQYAKRQETWFRARPEYEWIELGTGPAEAACARLAKEIALCR